MYKKNYTSWSNGFCSRYARLVQHLKINQHKLSPQSDKEEKQYDYINWHGESTLHFWSVPLLIEKANKIFIKRKKHAILFISIVLSQEIIF